MHILHFGVVTSLRRQFAFDLEVRVTMRPQPRSLEGKSRVSFSQGSGYSIAMRVTGACTQHRILCSLSPHESVGDL